jgi:DNA-binding winged helix-turn-helix (wHTH) protein
MALSTPKKKVVCFGLFEVDLEQRVLTKKGLRVRLQEQPFQVLTLLLERPHDVVSREELQQKLWPADTYVDFDDGLNTAIKKLRLALGDTADNPRFIETVPRRGYRFLAAPHFSEEQSLGFVGENSPATAMRVGEAGPDTLPVAMRARRDTDAATGRSARLRWTVLAVGGLLLTALVIAGVKLGARNRAIEPGVSSQPFLSPLTGSKRKVDPRAHEELVQARNFWKQRTAESISHAVEHYNLAIEFDPLYAEAYAGLANCYIVLPMLSTVPPDDSYAKARQAAERAISLDDTVAEAHLASAEVHLYAEWNFPAAEAEFQRALQLDSGHAQAHQWYAEFLSLMSRPQEAISQIQLAQRLDPTSMIIHHQAGQIYLNARMYPEALGEYRKALMIQPTFGPTYSSMAIAYGRQGRYRQSVEAEIQAYHYWDPGGPAIADMKKVSSACSGSQEACLRAALRFDQEHPSTPYNSALAYARLGDGESAMGYLRKSFDARMLQFLNVENDPEFDFLRTDSRFQELARKAGLSSNRDDGVSSVTTAK